MKLLIMRHAEAAPGYPDEQRQLTSRGRSSLEQMPQPLSDLIEQVDHIFVSPYLRTRQTLETLLDQPAYELDARLVPESSPEQVIELLQTLNDDATVLLVSHMPLVGALSGYLKSGPLTYGESFMTAQIEVLSMDYPAAGLATRDAVYYLQH